MNGSGSQPSRKRRTQERHPGEGSQVAFHARSVLSQPHSSGHVANRARPNPDRLASEVFAVAKHDLSVGDTLDAIGGTAYYSLIDTYETAAAERLLPIGLAAGATVTRPVAMDTPITADDVEIKPSTVYSLRQLQDQWSQGAIADAELLAAVDRLATD